MLAFSPHLPLPLLSSSRPRTSSPHILSPARKPRRCTRSPCPPPLTTTPVVSQLPHTASFTSPTSKPAGSNSPNSPLNSSLSPAATAATNAPQKQAHPHPVAIPTSTITSSSPAPAAPAPPTSPLSPKWILSYLKGNKDLVDAAMEDCLRPDARTTTLVSAMRYSLLAGGKRVRPNLAIAAFEMFAGPATGTAAEKARHLATVMPTALSVEMIHTMSLIHDDLPSMDDDDFRRGKPTNHKVYGEDIAILAGDALLAYAFEYVARHTPPGNSQRIVNVLRLLAESVGPQGLAGGQVMDLENEGQHNVPLDTLTWIHTHKTAVLLRVSCACGAILGGATEEDVERVSEFAVKTGLAFQIADDLLDVTQSTEVLGKTAGKDEVVNKATYPRLLGLEGSRRQAEQLINEAKQALAPYGERANTLIALADFIINRQN